MFQFSFKNRLAFNYLVSTALMVLFVFIIIYYIVSYTVYSRVENNLSLEVNDHLSEISVEKDNVCLVNPKEWSEKEHNTLNVNPVFVQIFDGEDHLIGKSPNLREHNLVFDESKEKFKSYNTILAGKSIKQIQFPVMHKGKLAGHILIAMPLEEANLILKNLSHVLWISYPIILILLFVAARFIAGRNIRPISSITQTASQITRENLQSRIELPYNKDELFVLSKTINDLLDRLENAIDREKQFTSDASHELRTPLAIVKGTLEVLIRKPREKQEYEAKIKYCIGEVNRLNNLVDQLLLLARFENQKFVTKIQAVEIDDIILQSLERFSTEIAKKNIEIDFKFDKHFTIVSDAYLISIIIENLLSNALKYSNDKGRIAISLSEDDTTIICAIVDNGIGIPEEDLDKIYGQFYRSRAVENPTIKGTGLGLSIVKRLCDLLDIKIAVESSIHSGTAFKITFLR